MYKAPTTYYEKINKIKEHIYQVLTKDDKVKVPYFMDIKNVKKVECYVNQLIAKGMLNELYKRLEKGAL